MTATATYKYRVLAGKFHAEGPPTPSGQRTRLTYCSHKAGGRQPSGDYPGGDVLESGRDDLERVHPGKLARVHDDRVRPSRPEPVPTVGRASAAPAPAPQPAGKKEAGGAKAS